MRKLLLLLPVVLALLVSGCTIQDPKEIVRESIEKLEAMDSYKASYELSLSVYGLTLPGGMDLYKKGEKARVDTDMGINGEGIVSSTYSLHSGTYTCTESLGNVTCIKGEAQSMISPDESLEMNMELIESGVIILSFNNIANLINRSCYNVTSDFEISKLDSLEPEAMTGLGIEEGMLSSLEAFTRFDIISCYDFETGIPLELSLLMEVNMDMLPEGDIIPGKISMDITMRAISFEPNAEIADSIFELPVQPKSLSEIQDAQTCTYSETGESMTYREAKDIALASECAENGTALIDDGSVCNDITGTWWIDLDLEKENCFPACVVDIVEETAEINWRCMGLIPE